MSCLGVAARELMKRRYGIERRAGSREEANVWYQALWIPRAPDLRGDLLVLAFHAAGWSGLLASRLAPDLRERYYMSMVLFLILFGVLHDAYVVLGLFDPVWNGLRRLQALLAALAATKERELRGGGLLEWRAMRQSLRKVISEVCVSGVRIGG